SVTVAGFTISLALVVALVDSTGSFSTAGQEWARSLFPGEFVVVSPVAQSPELVSEFAALPNVEQVSMIGTVPVISEGLALTAAGVEPDHYFQAFQCREGERTAAFRQMQRGRAVLVPAHLAQQRKLSVGQPLVMKAGQKEASFTIVGIISHSLPS